MYIRCTALFFLLATLAPASIALADPPWLTKALDTLWNQDERTQDKINQKTYTDLSKLEQRGTLTRLAKRLLPQNRKPLRDSISMKEARTIFRSMAKSRLGFGFPDHSCATRAHVSAAAIERGGITSYKVQSDFLGLYARTNRHPGGGVEWNHHVAPAVKINGVVHVLDPVLFKRPVTPEVWMTRMGITSTHSKPGFRVIRGRQFDSQGQDPGRWTVKDLASALGGAIRLRRAERARMRTSLQRLRLIRRAKVQVRKK